MSLLAGRFAAQQNRGGFIPFLVAGDPDLATTAAILARLDRLSPLAIEVGVPFSDPTADGPVIQRAAQRALRFHTSLAGVLEMLRRQRLATPLVLFTYYNPVLQLGLDRFARLASAAGVSAVLIVDLPAEAAAALQRQLRPRKIDLIFLVAPTTSDARLGRIAGLASGFIYVVARTGVTGNARKLRDESAQLVQRVRAATNLPVAVGFGIKNRRDAQRVCTYADAAVVGSRLVQEIEKVIANPKWTRADVVSAFVNCARQFADLR